MVAALSEGGGNGRRRPNSHDVAREAGVSRTTVSYVLNGRQDLSIPEETRARVRRAARALGYRPNRIAGSLASGRTQTLGMIVPCLDSYFAARIVDGVQDACAAGGYRLLLGYSRFDPEEEARQVGTMLEHQVDGIVLLAAGVRWAERNRWLENVVAEGTACVVINERVAHPPVDCVVSDDAAGAREGLSHLIGLGHRRIGHLSGGSESTSGRERLAGYRDALTSAGIPYDEELVVGHTFDEESGDTGMRALLSLPEPPTAVFAANDVLAANAVLAARDLGARVPGDVAVVGYSDDLLARWLRLTTVSQHPDRMGSAAVERLFARLQDPGLPAQTAAITTHLVVRESCGSTGAGGHEVRH